MYNFKIDVIQFITAARNMNQRIEYVLKWKDGWKNGVISSEEAKNKWPMLLLQFLEDRIVMANNPTNQPQPLPFSVNQNVDATGVPLKIWCMYSIHLGDDKSVCSTGKYLYYRSRCFECSWYN